ncbi:TetR family transcriptional regulator [Nocardioides dubius]|uniref:TetR/AcrR family transcriptional regulator n=1 Tax=Nocardioides dubius TaxID=317019 RepID=A0ABP4EQ72_9ACTN
MTVTPNAATRGPRTAARTLMIEVAEQLIAERGVEGVSLRNVGQAAGQRNNSAAQYHFGTRDGLVAAVIAHRSDDVEQRRKELLDALGERPEQAPLGDLVRCFVLPLAEMVDRGDAAHPTWYLRFLTQVVTLHGGHRAEEIAPRPEHMKVLEGALRSRLSHLDLATFARRMRWLAQVSVRALADQEYEREHDRQSGPIDPIVDDLVQMLVALLDAE